MKVFESHVGEGRLRVWGSISLCQEGAVLALFGGERPHIGSVVLALPRPSLVKGSGKRSTTSSVMNVLGHKDEVMAREAAEMAALKLDSLVSVTAGVHIKDASPEELDHLVENTRVLVDNLIDRGLRERERI